MEKLNDPGRPLRVSDDLSDAGDGSSAGEQANCAPWAGWAILRPIDGNASAAGIGRALRDHYEDVVAEAIPDPLKDLLTRLG